MAATAARFRDLALALPDTVEGAHHGSADFRHGGRIFATLHGDGRGTGMVRVAPDRQRELLAAAPDAFAPAAGAWGRAGCTIVQLAQVSGALLRDALADAWQHAHAAGGKRAAKK